jgi:hypothetical protein
MHKMQSPRLFALETDKAYQVMPIDALVGDKLTTLAVNTVGIPPERADEYVKQVYDLDSLIEFNWEHVDFDQMTGHLIHWSELEAKDRGILFDMGAILSDMTDQMDALSAIDFEKDDRLRKLINDFQSLYLRKSARKTMGEWAMVGARLRFLTRCLNEGARGKEKMGHLKAMESKLRFDDLQGERRGVAIRLFRERFAGQFAQSCKWPARTLKGKSPARILLAVASPDNIEEVRSWIEDYFEPEQGT